MSHQPKEIIEGLLGNLPGIDRNCAIARAEVWLRNQMPSPATQPGLEERLRDNANAFACGDYGAVDIRDRSINDDVAKLLREAANALAAKDAIIAKARVALEARGPYIGCAALARQCHADRGHAVTCPIGAALEAMVK